MGKWGRLIACALPLACAVGSNESGGTLGASGPAADTNDDDATTLPSIDPSGVDSASDDGTGSTSADGSDDAATIADEDDDDASVDDSDATTDPITTTDAPGPICGNGIVEADEACDDDDLGAQTCVGLGFAGGVLGCMADCTGHDTSACVAAPSCGDGIKNGAEQCDGGDLGGATCQTLGWDMGVLSCAANCSLDTGGCANAACTPLFGSCSMVPCCAGLICIPFEEVCFVSP